MPGHVLFLCETYPPDPGGLARAGQRISTALEPHCASLKRLCLDENLSPASACFDPERNLVRLGPFPKEDETCQLIEQYVAHLQPLDLVHAFYGGPKAAAAVAGALRAGKPSLVSLRGNDLDKGLYRNPLLEWTLSHAAAVTCVSREQQHKLRVWFQIDEERAPYIPNSVDGSLFYPDLPLDDLAPNQKLVVFAGEMRWKKGLQIVLQVHEQAQNRFQIALVGGCREKKLPKDLLQIPYQHDPHWMRRLYCRADVVWLPALWEGMPNTLLEAMACARPVLAHRVGGVTDLVDEERGWLLDLNQAEEHLETILQILRNPDKKGERARQHVLRKHRPEKETESYLKVYAEVSGAFQSKKID